MPSLWKHRKLGAVSVPLALFLLFVCLPWGVAWMVNLPEASGTTVYKKNGCVIDASHADQGYIMVSRKSSKKQQVKVIKGKEEYNYPINLEGNYDIIPLQMGSGSYKVEFYEQVSGTKYSAKYKKEFNVTLVDENVCFLYPNFFVPYDANTKAIELAAEICKDATTDLEKYKAIAAYVKKNITYDYIRAIQSTTSNIVDFIPDVDLVLEKSQGICFDYAAVMACMLRSQGVPTKMVMGFAENTYHAWNRVLIDGQWGLADITFAASGKKLDSDKYTVDKTF